MYDYINSPDTWISDFSQKRKFLADLSVFVLWFPPIIAQSANARYKKGNSQEGIGRSFGQVSLLIASYRSYSSATPFWIYSTTNTMAAPVPYLGRSHTLWGRHYWWLRQELFINHGALPQTPLGILPRPLSLAAQLFRNASDYHHVRRFANLFGRLPCD